MADIALNSEGDLQLALYDNNSVDFDLLTGGDELKLLLKRALETPKGYITQFQIQSESVRKYNSRYGNDIYKELSENVSAQLLTRIRSHILNAVRVAQIQVRIQDVRIQIQDLRTLNVFIVFSDNQVMTTTFRI